MPIVAHVLRRGAVYYWRRRIVGGPGPGRVLVVSLNTKDQDEARRRSAALTHMSEQVFEDVRRGRLTADEARAIMVAVALEQSETLARAAVADRARCETDPMSGPRADRIVGAVYRLLAERGRAANLQADEEPFLRACGLAADEAFQVQTTLEVFRRQRKVPAPEWKIRDLLTKHAPDVEPTAMARTEAETAFYRGKAAACLDVEKRWGDTSADGIEVLRAALSDGPPSVRPRPEPAVSHRATHTKAAHIDSLEPEPRKAETEAIRVTSREPEASDIPTTITGLGEKLVETRRKTARWTPKTATQMASTASLLARVVRHGDFRRLRQQDFAIYRDVLLALPKSYGKSSKDATKTVAQLLAAARHLPEDERGLGPVTINRHLTHLGNLLKFAASYGITPAEKIDLSLLREKENERARDQRPAMTPADIEALMTAPVWRGCASETKRLGQGDAIIHDSLYWVPLIAIYSLMRREEICGLMIADVRFDAAIPFFDIVPNAYRRLKNPQSKRRSIRPT